MLREVKSNPYQVLTTFIEDSKNYIGLRNGEIKTIKLTEVPILDRYSTGSQISKKELTSAFEIVTLKREKKYQDQLLEDIEEPVILKEEMKNLPKKEKISLQEIDDQLMTIDDFLKKDD